MSRQFTEGKKIQTSNSEAQYTVGQGNESKKAERSGGVCVGEQRATKHGEVQAVGRTGG